MPSRLKGIETQLHYQQPLRQSGLCSHVPSRLKGIGEWQSAVSRQLKRLWIQGSLSDNWLPFLFALSGLEGLETYLVALFWLLLIIFLKISSDLNPIMI